MTAIIIIGIIIFIIYTATKKKKPVQQRSKVTNSNVRKIKEQEMNDELDENILKSSKNVNFVNQTPLKTVVIIEDKNFEQTEIVQNPILNKNKFESEIEVKNIFDIEASIVHKLSKEVGKITKLSGRIGNGEIKLFLALDDWKKFSIDFLPSLSIEFEVDKDSNLIILNSSNKEISPLKKGDLFRIYFEDESFIEKKFEVGRIQSGKNVKNIIFLNDVELTRLSHNTISHIETFSGLKIPYEFTEIENKQYSNSTEGKKLFQIICEKIIGIKSLLTNSNKNLTSSQKSVVAPLLSNIESENHILSKTIKELPKIEIGKILKSLLLHKESNGIESFSKVKIDDSIIDVTDQSYRINSSNNLPIFHNSINPIEPNEKYSDSSIKEFTKLEVSEIQQPLLLNEQSDDSIQLFSEIKNDDSIVEITDQSYGINSNNNLKKHSSGVPNWAHHYVYSFSEINSASKEQKEFYSIFKNSFLKEEYLDIEGNTNYAFILLFDLLEEYDKHNDISKLESQLKKLGQFYPKTKSYGVSFLVQKMTENGDNAGVSRFLSENRLNYQNNDIDFETFNWRNKYKNILNLNKDEADCLDKLWYPSNNFSSIEFCSLEIIKLYLSLISELKNRYNQEGTTMDVQFFAVADVIARNHFKYKIGSQNYKYCIETTSNEFYSQIFKHCENAVREYYIHKRKLNTDTYYTTEEAKTEYEAKIISKVTELLPNLICKVAPPDEATNIELNTQNTNRWKIQFEELAANYTGKPENFIDSIISLGKLNFKNPSVENIFFESSKFIAKHDKQAALILYVHYLYHDLKSATFDNKQLTKTIQKSLFKTNEQLHDFEIIVSELINDRNLEKAVKGVAKVYEVKRKKIQLDSKTINEVQQKHSGTVELLNEYLKDEYEDETNTIKTQESGNEEIEIVITQKNDPVQNSAFIAEIAFSAIHLTALELFSKRNFSISQIELEAFAKSKGVFKNQLIESINETCYDFLDDVLIEEEDDYYSINTNYFQRITAK